MKHGTLTPPNMNHSDIELYTESYGEGPPILLLHGFGGTTYTWRHLVPQLSERNRVILVDLKGHGRSPKPRDDAYSLFDQADLLMDFIRDKDLRDITIIGNSYGGGVGLITTLKLRDAQEAGVERLILIDSIGYPQRPPFYIAILRIPFIGPLSLALVSPEVSARMVLKEAYFDDSKIPEEAIEEYARPLREPEGKYALVQAARQAIPSNIDSLVNLYRTIETPTLIIWGRDDEIIPLSVGKQLVEALPNATLRIIPECGHVPQEECPEVLLPMIRAFLR